MGFRNKLNKSTKAWMQTRAKTNYKIYGFLGWLFFFIALYLLISNLVSGNIAPALFGGIIFLLISLAFLWAGKRNHKFLVKMGVEHKTHIELAVNYLKSIVDLFRK